MLDQFIRPFSSFIQSLATSIAGSDSVSKGLVTMWIISGLILFSRKLPGQFMAWLRRISIVSMRMETCDDRIENKLYQHAMVKVMPLSKSKRFFLRTCSTDDGFTTMSQQDYGTSWFIHKGRLYWMERSKSTKQSWNREESVIFYTFGRNISAFDFLYKDFSLAKLPSYRKPTYEHGSMGWSYLAPIAKTTSLFLPDEVKSIIDEKVDFFIDNRQWYVERNIPWKLVILLHGEPGTGKTSCTQYIAQRLNWSIGNLDLAALNKGELLPLMIDAGKQGLVVSIEDFDVSMVGSKRTIVRTEEKKQEDNNEEKLVAINQPVKNNSLGLDLYDLLNVFQGTVPLNGNVVVLSTNDIGGLDPALIRKSRMDLVLEVGRVGYPQIKAYFEHNYPGVGWPEGFMQNAKIKGCDLHGTFMDYPMDPKGFIETITTLESHVGT